MIRPFLTIVMVAILSVAASAQKITFKEYNPSEDNYQCDTLAIVTHIDDDDNVFYRNPLYEKITPENLVGFISEWKAYSHFQNKSHAPAGVDSALCVIASSFDVNEALLAREFKMDRVPDNHYVVIWQNIPVRDYEVAENGSRISKNRTITPNLPENGLYLNPAIEAKLREFVRITEYSEENPLTINSEHLAMLENFINVGLSNSGAYTFLSYPAVARVSIGDDETVTLHYIANSEDSCQLRYNHTGDEYVPDTQLYSGW